jgi:G3E family GTPase
VEACDVALVNKTDLHDEDALRSVEREIERINPRAKIVRTRYCRTEIDILAAPTRSPMEGEYALCRDPSYESVTLHVVQPLDPGPLLAELQRVKDDVYRVKGLVPVADGTLYVDVAAGRLSHREIAISSEAGSPAGEVEPGRLVFIFEPEASELVEEVIAKLTARARVESLSN